jgi:Flp pilus assembly protein TadB
MNGELLAAVAGALLVGGVVLGIWAAVPQPVRPARPPRQGQTGARWRAIPRARRIGAVVALAVGVVVALTTGWVVAAVALPAAVLGLPAILMVSDESRTIARLEAISEWTRNLAGVLTAGQGIEGAINASLRSAPDAIRPELSRLAARLRARWSTEDALRAFADDLDDATGDLVCSALILGASKRGDGLARVLTGLSESVAEDVRARRQIEADRAKPRSTARTVTLISVAALAFLALSGQFLAPYSTPGGQVVLVCLLAAYTGCLWWLRRMSLTAPPPRFLGAKVRKAAAR